MYKNYKSSLAQPKKTGLPKGQASKQASQNAISQKVIKPKPEWNDTVKDDYNYKLSASEIVQKKISLMSKHRLEAKEEWLERQEKLRKGVLDDETKRIYDTARQSKNLSSRDDEFQRKNLSQMLNFIPKQQRDPKAVVDQVNQNLKDTRKFIEKMEQYQNDEDPNRLLRVMDRLQSNKEVKQNRWDSSASIQTQKGFGGSQRKSARSMSSQNVNTDISQNGQRSSNPKQEQTEHDFFSSSSKENKQDMANYFNSLDKIEETIKFMEEKILCEKKSPKKQNDTPSTVIEKKLFNEIQEISDKPSKDQNMNNFNQLKEYNIADDDEEEEENLARNNNFYSRSNKIEARTMENLKDIRGSVNASKQINTSRGSKNIENELSFNLTDGDDESSMNPYGNKQQRKNKSPTQSSEMRVIDTNEKYLHQNNKNNNNNYESDLIVNDFKCNIDVIDPNMFFNNDGDDDDNDYDYGYSKPNNKQSGNYKFDKDDTFKSNHQKNYESKLQQNNDSDQKQQQPQHYEQKRTSLTENYNMIAEKKKQELNNQANTVKFQHNTNHIYSQLKQQTEDDSDLFYVNRVTPSAHNLPHQLSQQQSQQKQQQQQQQNTINSNIYQKLPLQKEVEYDEEEDYLSRNIDQLKEMLDATKKDLEKLECNPSDENELNYFSTQYTNSSSNESATQGRKLQKQVPIARNSDLSYQQQQIDGIKKMYQNPVEQQEEQRDAYKQSNPPFLNSYQQLEKNTGSMYTNDPNYKNAVCNNFFQTENEPQNFFTSNMFLSGSTNGISQQQTNSSYQNNSQKNQSDNTHFTSNIFLNNNISSSTNAAKPNQTIQNNTQFNQDNDRTESHLDIPRHSYVVKQNMFKKQLSNYSNQGIKPQDSLNIRHHLK